MTNYDMGQDIDPNNMDEAQLEAWNELSRSEKIELLKAQQQMKQECYKMADEQIKPFEALRKGWTPMESPYQKGDPESVALQHDMKTDGLRPEYQELAKSMDPAIAYLTQKINDNKMNTPAARLWANAGQTLAKQETNYNELIDEAPTIDMSKFNLPMPGQLAGNPMQQTQQQVSPQAQKATNISNKTVKDNRTGQNVAINGGVSDEEATAIFRNLFGRGA